MIYGKLGTLVFFQQEYHYYGCQLLKSHALLIVNMYHKKHISSSELQVKKEKEKRLFCAVLLQFRIDHTCIRTLTSTHLHAYIHQKETTPFYAK